MDSFWYYLYNALGVPLLHVGSFLGAFVNPKIRKGVQGRKGLFNDLEEKMETIPKRGFRFWIHCSSMGEFEQAKPLVDRLKERFPGGSIIVSFFSPSVFEHVQEYKGADHLCYLPLDSRGRAKRFLSLIRPDMAIIIRHDLWPNHLWQLKKQEIPTVLINCTIHPQSYNRFPHLLQVNRFLFEPFDLLLTVSQEAKDFCEKYRIGGGNVVVVGDTRYDQVVRRAQEVEKITVSLRNIKGKRKGLVAGSTWPADEDVLLEALDRLSREGISLWTVLVPHEPSEERTHQLEQKISSSGHRCRRFSELESGNPVRSDDILIVDRMGILASLYGLGELTYVGGGFGVGIHNVLEPAAFGKVVLFGPRSKNSYEAGQLVKRGVGFVVKSGEGLYNILSSLLEDSDRLAEMGKMAERLVQENVGATDRIVNHIDDLVRSQ
jgi:3-deoxy-D-manno-octulosonic-acid transferase